MLNSILATKSKMSQAFAGTARVSVTVVQAGPCVLTQIKTLEKDGYWGLQLGFGQKKLKNVKKPIKGHLKGVIKKEDKMAPRYLAEIKFSQEPKKENGEVYKVGDQIKIADIFHSGDLVSVTGISKGKGFAGVVKRWHFAGGPKTHGQSDRHRAPGAIGQGTTPGRVWKGKRMAGRMGGQKITIKNLKVVEVDSEKDEMKLSGPVPGAFGKLLVIQKTREGDKKDA